jgi:hypothetical protein
VNDHRVIGFSCKTCKADLSMTYAQESRGVVKAMIRDHARRHWRNCQGLLVWRDDPQKKKPPA